MEKTKVFGALRATTLAALAAGGLLFATAGCSSTQTDGAAEKSCGEKSCGQNAGGEKSCGEKSCGEKSCG